MLANVTLIPLQKAYTRKQKRDALDSLADWQALTAALSASLSPYLYSLVIATGRQAMEDLGIDPSQFDASTAPVRNYSTDRADKISGSINEETQKQLRAAISQALDSGVDVAGLTAVISGVFGAALTYRSSRIAATESTAAQGFADTQAWQQSGIVTGKEFFTQADERVCPFCNALDGAIMALDEPFFRMGDTIVAGGKSMTVAFEDLQSPPVHVGCRCTLMDVTLN